MSRDKNLWHRLGLAIGAGIQDNQLALPYEWDERLQASPMSKTASIRKISWPQRTAQTPAVDSTLEMETLAA